MSIMGKKKLEIPEESHEEDNIYGDFMKTEIKEEPIQEEKVEQQPQEQNNVVQEEPPIEPKQEGYVYKEKEYKTNTLEEKTKVTNASRFSRVLLVGFYLMLLVLGVGAFLMIRANKYEFYLKTDSVLIDSGSSYQVELIPKDIRYFDYTNYNYSIGDTNIATVDEYGTVTAVGRGETTLKISLKTGFSSKTMKIIADEVSVTNVDLNIHNGEKIEKKENVSMKVNQSMTLKPIVNDRKDLNVTGVYHSSDENVVEVDDFGNITAKNSGTAVITGEVHGVEDTIVIEVKKDPTPIVVPTPTVTVKPSEKPSNPTVKPTVKPTVAPTVKPTATPKPVITNIHMNTSTMSIKKGSTAQLTVVITPSELASSTLDWKSSNTKVATVNSKGVVTGVAVGKATITAKTTNGLTAKCEITVTTDEVKVTSITLNKTAITINMGATFQLLATINPSNATVRKLIWTTDDDKIATVTQDGLVTGKGAGTTVIMVTSSDGKAVAKCNVTVKKVATPAPTVKPTVKPTATPKPTVKPTVAPTVKPTTKPSSSTQPKVTAVSLGIASQTSKYVGEQLQLSASVTPSTVTNYTTNWSSSNTSVATVDKNGLVKCIGAGTVVITAEVNGVKGTATIVVKNKVVTTPKPTVKPTVAPSAPSGTQFTASAIKLDKTSLTVDKGKTASFKITLTKAVGTVTITSSNTSILKVSLPAGDSDAPICNQSSNLCFLDGFNSTDEITITVNGVSSGTGYVNISINDIETTSGETLTGSAKVGILVK